MVMILGFPPFSNNSKIQVLIPVVLMLHASIKPSWVTGNNAWNQVTEVGTATASNRTISVKIVELAERVILLAAASVAEKLVLLHVCPSLSCSLIQLW
jgi:hypothetical protein